MEKKLLVVVPVYNEEDKIAETIEGLKKIKYINKILVVNDGSIDNTGEVIKNLGVSVITFKKNKGKGYAMKKVMKEEEYDYIAFIDGDLGKSSGEIKKLIEPVIYNKTDFTIAKFQKRSDIINTKGGFGLVKTLARKGVYFFTQVEINTSLSGQRVYKKKVIKDMDYIPNDFGIEVAMTIQALNNNYRFIEVPVSMTHNYTKRTLKGFKHRGKQFVEILKTLIIMFFSRWRNENK